MDGLLGIGIEMELLQKTAEESLEQAMSGLQLLLSKGLHLEGRKID